MKEKKSEYMGTVFYIFNQMKGHIPDIQTDNSFFL